MSAQVWLIGGASGTGKTRVAYPTARAVGAPIVDLQIAVAEALVPALDAVAGNHLETRVPVVIGGDYLLPSSAARSSYAGQPVDGQVRAVFLNEPDERRLVRNDRDREPDAGTQAGRARGSRLYGARQAREGTRWGVPVVKVRPWATAGDRVLATLRGG